MHALPASDRGADESWLFGPGAAWFAYAMTLALMVMDYVDRQVIVSLFPYMKAEWNLSDQQLGALVSVVSVTVALGALPVALFADRVSRVKSIAVMALVWSAATASCMFARGWGVLLGARALVGLGEAGYGSVGAALIASHFPARLRATVLAGFFAAASVGSVLGVMLGGLIAAHWGWKAAFGVVGVPGMVLALLYLKVRDYRTVAPVAPVAPVVLVARGSDAAPSPLRTAGAVLVALARTRTLPWVCAGAAMQLIVVSALWSWLPSFLNRVHGMTPAQAGTRAALVVLCGAAGSVVCGWLADRAGRAQPQRRLHVMALLCVVAAALLGAAFGLLQGPAQLALIALGGFVATCTVGPATVVLFGVIHPGMRATGASVLALFQNLFGLALGPLIGGALSDHLGLTAALTLTPAFGVLAALALLCAAPHYDYDLRRMAATPERSPE
jgi:MFS family permease